MEQMNGKELAQVVANAVNNFSFDNRAFCEEMNCQHRTLQDNFNMLVIAWIEKCKEQYQNGRYDARNEYRLKVLAEVADVLRGVR